LDKCISIECFFDNWCILTKSINKVKDIVCVFQIDSCLERVVVHIVIEVVFECYIDLIIWPFGVDWISQVIMFTNEVSNWNCINLMDRNYWNNCRAITSFIFRIGAIIELFPDTSLESLTIMENLFQWSSRIRSICINFCPSWIIPFGAGINECCNKSTDMWNKGAQSSKAFI